MTEMDKTIDTKNPVHALRIKAMHSSEDISQLCRRMAEVFEASHQADDDLRQKARTRLLAAASANLVPETERIVRECGEQLRARLFDLFSEELTRSN